MYFSETKFDTQRVTLPTSLIREQYVYVDTKLFILQQQAISLTRVEDASKISGKMLEGREKTNAKVRKLDKTA